MDSYSSHKLLLTCEHKGYGVPDKYQPHFMGADDILKSHRGWDPGAGTLAECLSEALQAPLISYPFTRLLIEPNRSEHNPKLFSEYTVGLSDKSKKDLLNNYYRPHRRKVTDEIYKLISDNKRVLHIGVHTFTPELHGRIREFDIGLLYDPSRKKERGFAERWKKSMKYEFKVRLNQPYKGKADGLITTLRKLFSEEVYLGIELEVNQKLYFESQEKWDLVCGAVAMFLANISR